jgi:hypothetical protein
MGPDIDPIGPDLEYAPACRDTTTDVAGDWMVSLSPGL